MSTATTKAPHLEPEAGTHPADTKRRRLGEVLLAAGVIDSGQLESALAERMLEHDHRERLGAVIVRLGYATDEDLASALAEQLGLEYLDDEHLSAASTTADAVPESIAARHSTVPLKWEDDDTLVVACTDPTDVVAGDDVRLAAGARALRRVVVTRQALQEAHRRIYGDGTDDLLEAVDDHAEDEQEALEGSDAVEGPIVRLAEQLLRDAVTAGASDVHIEPEESGTVVRYRIDGVLHHVNTVPRKASRALLSRLKIMSQMDIAERRLPQDGRMRLRSNEGEVDLRVATLPSMYGETLVLRLLRKGDEQLRIDDVGFSPEQRQAALEGIERPQGLVLLTGPTGSGKTSTLYALLRELAGESRNIITLEDPVEYQLPGVNQTQINERIGLTFPRSLRTVLRQDPDVVMVGEIRDPETAELALQASLTGHLVLSTLHTNDAPSAVVRLRDLGIPPYLVASALTMVIGQRLVRQLCQACALPAEPGQEPLPEAGSTEREGLRVGPGCRACARTGYRGRTGLYEILTVDTQVSELVASQGSVSAIRHAGRNAGMRSLREDGLAKAKAGITSIAEVLRVTPADATDERACPACTQSVEDDFAHCPWCGTNLEPPRCAACERDLHGAWLVCPSCGTPREEAARASA